MAEQGPLSGQLLGGGRYRLGELLGEGAFGAVYAAEHTLLGRPQAIKILLDRHFSNPKFRVRFLREARTVASLDHAHIVHIDDFGLEEESSRAYLVMPFIEGGTFEAFLRGQSRPLELDRALYYLEQICSALDYAHQRGVVHLDLKPLNLLLHDENRLLLSDFGLAHLLEQDVVYGGTSLMYGTPHFMAPEHINAHPEKRSDLYSLGIIVYQMLAGRLPFEGPPGSVMIRHLTEMPTPLSTIRPDLPDGFDALMLKLLAKQVDERYATAGEVLGEMKVVLARSQEQQQQVEEQQRTQEHRKQLQHLDEQRQAEIQQLRTQLAEEQRKTSELRAQRETEQRQLAEEQRKQLQRLDEQRKAEVQQLRTQLAGEQRKTSEARTQLQVAQREAEQGRLAQQRRRQQWKSSMGGVATVGLFLGLGFPDLCFLLLGILGFIPVTGVHLPLWERLSSFGLAGLGILFTVIFVFNTSENLWPRAIYVAIIGVLCLVLGIGGLVNAHFYAFAPYLAITAWGLASNIVWLAIGLFTVLGPLAFVISIPFLD